MMKNLTKMPNTFFFIIILFLFLLSFRSLYADTSSHHNNHEEQKAKQKLSLTERAIHAITTTRESYKSSWLKIKDRLQELRMQLSSPDLEPTKDANPKEAAEKIKEAVQKSSEASKDAAERSAKSAATAVHKTADKLKFSDAEQESKSEL